MRKVVAVLASVLVGVALLAGPTGAAPGGGQPATLNERFVSFPVSVSGDYIPLVGSCGGDFILWYAPGPAPDHLWEFTDNGVQHTSMQLAVNGHYEPFVADFDGNTCDDIFWYAPGTGQDFVWWNNHDFADVDSRPVTVNGVYEPVILELDFAGWDDIFWYAPGPAPEFIWEGQIDQRFESASAPPVNGHYRVAGYRNELLFHGPGTAPDYLWSGVTAGASSPGASTPVTLNGDYQLLASNREFGSVVLYGPGAGTDQLLTSMGGPPLQFFPGSVNGVYRMGRSSPTVSHRLIVWHAPGSATDHIWRDPS